LQNMNNFLDIDCILLKVIHVLQAWP